MTMIGIIIVLQERIFCVQAWGSVPVKIGQGSYAERSKYVVRAHPQRRPARGARQGREARAAWKDFMGEETLLRRAAAGRIQQHRLRHLGT